MIKNYITFHHFQYWTDSCWHLILYMYALQFDINKLKLKKVFMYPVIYIDLELANKTSKTFIHSLEWMNILLILYILINIATEGKPSLNNDIYVLVLTTFEPGYLWTRRHLNSTTFESGYIWTRLNLNQTIIWNRLELNTTALEIDYIWTASYLNRISTRLNLNPNIFETDYT